jgi:phthalate 4,5-cis-dihydrodiol dehydrogenase
MTETSSKPIKAGVVGLGQLGGGILNYLAASPEIDLVAAADPRESALSAFSSQYGGRTYPTLERLCADPDVEAVWVATPSALHCEHVVMLAEHGKHSVVTKPMAMSLAECDQMVEAAEKNRVALIYSGMPFSPAFLAMRRTITSGRIGGLKALSHQAYSDWMLRPREPHEVEVEMDGGQLFNQGPHAVDALRLLGGGLVRSVRGAMVELPLAARPSAGYFTAFLEFEDGTPATLMYNGYGYLFGWELTAWGETAARQAAADDSYEFRRQLRNGAIDEVAEKEASRYGGAVEGGSDFRSRRPRSEGWVPGDDGLLIATCERGTVRQSATGLYVYDDAGRHEEALPAGSTSRSNEINELRSAMAGGPAFRDGRWGRATLEVVLAIARSAAEKRELTMQHQVPVPPL